MPPEKAIFNAESWPKRGLKVTFSKQVQGLFKMPERRERSVRCGQCKLQEHSAQSNAQCALCRLHKLQCTDSTVSSVECAVQGAECTVLGFPRLPSKGRVQSLQSAQNAACAGRTAYSA